MKCTCHEDDRPPVCQHFYAASACQHAYATRKTTKDFQFAHLVPAPYRARMAYNVADDATNILRIDRLLPNKTQHGIDILWNLPPDATDAEAQPVIDQMLSTLARHCLTQIDFEGKLLSDMTPSEHAHTMLKLLDKVEALRWSLDATTDAAETYATQVGQLQDALGAWRGAAFVCGLVAIVALLF